MSVPIKKIERVKTILAWSGGKDSTATAILAKSDGIKIDKIITVMPDPFKKEFVLLEKFEDYMGQKVTFVEAPTFEQAFFRKKVRGPHVGTIYGWPFTVFKTCARIMKFGPMNLYCKSLGKCNTLVGIAKGEKRILADNTESLLINHGLTECDAKKLCEKEGLLNPLYSDFKRLGCVRCPKQSIPALRKVKELEPEKWQWMKDNDKFSPVSFKPNKTLSQIIGQVENQ